MCTGSRGYSRHPIIFDQLSRKLTDLSVFDLHAMKDRPVATIQAILLLCAWPLPAKTLSKDASTAMAGLALQLSIQSGLHTFYQESEFMSRTKSRRPVAKTLTERLAGTNSESSTDHHQSEIRSRTSLWINSLIVFQRWDYWPHDRT